MDATDQAALVSKGEVTPSELLEAAIERIERSNPALNAVVIEWFDHARSVAADPDLPEGPFRGVPFLLKDLYTSFAGQTVSNGNVALKAAGKIDAADTTLVARFKAAGLVIAGRTNTPEMGSLPTTQPVAWGATRNPWALERTPGGSSGGAAAAVAVGMVPFANASDGGGSIRIPASCCGLVGLKPSQGRITVGPARAEVGLGVELCISHTVRDTAGLLDAVRGPGVGDTVIAPAPERLYVDEVGADPGMLRIRRLRRGAGGWVGLSAGAAAVVGRRLGPATHADAGRAAGATDGVREQPRAPDGTDAPGRAVRRVHAGVQHERATGDQPAPASQHRRHPHRHPTRRRLRPAGHPRTRRRPTGIGPPVVVRPPGNPLTVVASVSCGGRLRVIGLASDGWRCVIA